MKFLANVFLKGLLTLTPILLTVYVVYWTATTSETLLEKVIPARIYIQGMGIAAGILVVLAFGFLLQAWLFQALFAMAERLLARIPLVKSLYSSIKDMLGFFGGADRKAIGQVVLVQVGEPGAELLGFVTRDEFADLPEGFGATGMVAVYLPMSYQIGGFTLLVPRERVRPVDMSTEEALRFAVTAGMKSGK